MFDTCVGIRDRSCVKRSKARQHVSTEPRRRADLFLFRTVSSPSVRKQSSSSRYVLLLRSSLFTGHPPFYVAVSERSQSSLLEKLLYLGPFARSMNYQSDGMSSLLFATSYVRAYVWKLNFISSWLLRHSFSHLCGIWKYIILTEQTQI